LHGQLIVRGASINSDEVLEMWGAAIICVVVAAIFGIIYRHVVIYVLVGVEAGIFLGLIARTRTFFSPRDLLKFMLGILVATVSIATLGNARSGFYDPCRGPFCIWPDAPTATPQVAMPDWVPNLEGLNSN
jgi:hypothetical protein